MRTYKGKPWMFSNGVELVSEWESSGGGLFHNPRVVLLADGVRIQQWPFADTGKAQAEAARLSLERGKARRTDELQALKDHLASVEKEYAHLQRKVAHGCTDATCNLCDSE